MGLTDKLDLLMKEKNINKAELARESGVPYTTIDGFYKKGSDNAKLSTLKKLCSYFGCSLDFLADDSVIDGNSNEEDILEEEMIKNFRKLNSNGKRAILCVMDHEVFRNLYSKTNENKKSDSGMFFFHFGGEDDTNILNAAHKRTDIDIPEDADTSEDDVMDEKKF